MVWSFCWTALLRAWVSCWIPISSWRNRCPWHQKMLFTSYICLERCSPVCRHWSVWSTLQWPRLRIDYSGMLCIVLPSLKTIWKLKLVQNTAAHMLSWASWWGYVTSTQMSVHWLLIICRVWLKTMVLTFKAFNNPHSTYLEDCLSLCVPKWLLPSSQQSLLSVPLFSKVSSATVRAYGFSMAAPCLWDSLLERSQELLFSLFSGEVTNRTVLESFGSS